MPCKCLHYTEVEESPVEEAKGVKIRWLITKEDGAPNFSMRYFEVEPNASTPLHNHPWEHEVFILEGEAQIKCQDKTFQAKEGYFIYVPPNVEHTFINTSNKTLRFICLIPHQK